MDEALKKAFDFAQDVTKQVLTLATGIIVITITFFKDFAANASGTSRVLMAVSWVIYLASVIFGVMTLESLTGMLERPREAGPSIYTKGIRIVSGLQMIFFVSGLFLSVIAGILMLSRLR